MKIEFLYFDGCPNHVEALEILKKALAIAGVDTNIEIFRIETEDDVLNQRFLGSPSIRIDNADLEITEDETTTYSMRCRRYKQGDRYSGYPSLDKIVEKLRRRS